MDPYDILGVRKNCTRDELKEAFRTKAQLVHPDRGGDAAAFIQLRQAFDHIEDELIRRTPDAPVVKLKPPTRQERRSSSPDPNWDPELIIRDEPLPRRRPARPRDPDWQPDLIVVDDPPEAGIDPAGLELGPGLSNSHDWVRSLADRTDPAGATPPAFGWNKSGMLAAIIAILLTAWICWAAWSHDPPTDTSRVVPTFDPMKATD